MYFRDDTCTDVRKDVIRDAFASPMEMAKAASKHEEDLAMDLFGPDAVSKITPQNLASTVSRAADFFRIPSLNGQVDRIINNIKLR